MVLVLQDISFRFSHSGVPQIKYFLENVTVIFWIYKYFFENLPLSCGSLSFYFRNL